MVEHANSSTSFVNFFYELTQVGFVKTRLTPTFSVLSFLFTSVCVTSLLHEIFIKRLLRNNARKNHFTFMYKIQEAQKNLFSQSVLCRSVLSTTNALFDYWKSHYCIALIKDSKALKLIHRVLRNGH